MSALLRGLALTDADYVFNFIGHRRTEENNNRKNERWIYLPIQNVLRTVSNKMVTRVT